MAPLFRASFHLGHFWGHFSGPKSQSNFRLPRGVAGFVDVEFSEESVEDEDEGDVEAEVGRVAEAVLRPVPVPIATHGRQMHAAGRQGNRLFSARKTAPTSARIRPNVPNLGLLFRPFFTTTLVLFLVQ